MKVRAEYMI